MLLLFSLEINLCNFQMKLKKIAISFWLFSTYCCLYEITYLVVTKNKIVSRTVHVFGSVNIVFLFVSTNSLAAKRIASMLDISLGGNKYSVISRYRLRAALRSTRPPPRSNELHNELSSKYRKKLLKAHIKNAHKSLLRQDSQIYSTPFVKSRNLHVEPQHKWR